MEWDCSMLGFKRAGVGGCCYLSGKDCRQQWKLARQVLEKKGDLEEVTLSKS
jgi:hypothetical protein